MVEKLAALEQGFVWVLQYSPVIIIPAALHTHPSIPNAIYSQEQTALLSQTLKEFFGRLGCYAAYPGSWLPKFRDSLSVPFSNANALHCLKHKDDTHARNVGKQIPAYAA